jgi:peptidoglycan/xylan/chitin deacetylase (PgdA/CDA1 family)
VSAAAAVAWLALSSLASVAPPAGDQAPAAADRHGAACSREVVITLDDLPLARGGGSAADVDRVTDALLDALRRHGVPAVGFVNGGKVLVRGQVDARLDALRRWLDAGAELGNHSHSHLGFQGTPLERYQDDVLLGDLFPRLLMAEREQAVRYYRHPFNQTGPSPDAKAAFQAFAAERGYQVVPFTVEHADYIFERLWTDARAAGRGQEADRLLAAYQAQLDLAFDFAEGLARETFGGAIPQVFLIHANEINARALDAMLTRLEQRGYCFISMAEALAHPAYATPDTYVAGNGVSWLHRWRHSLGLDSRIREEPDPPAFVLKAWLAVQREQAAAASAP